MHGDFLPRIQCGKGKERMTFQKKEQCEEALWTMVEEFGCGMVPMHRSEDL